MLSIRAASRLLLATGCLALPEMAFAGAWTWDEGKGQISTALTATSATAAFDGDRNLGSRPRYNKTELQALIEYGVTKEFTMMLTPALQHVDIAAPVDAKRTGLGFSEFGGRYRIWEAKDWVVSGQAVIRVPGTFDTVNPAAIGNNGVETDLRALFGWSFKIGAWPAFLNLEVAQRFRTNGPPDEVRADGTLGVQFLPKWLALVQVYNVISEGARPPVFPSYDYSKFQFSVAHELSKQWTLQLGAVSTISGRNALQENGVVFGAWYRF